MTYKQIFWIGINIIASLEFTFGLQFIDFKEIPCELDQINDTYKAKFTFLDNLGFGFVHADARRIQLEYYLPNNNSFILFSTIDQRNSHECSNCYFSTAKNTTNLFSKCMYECFNYKTFVGAININNQWDVMEPFLLVGKPVFQNGSTGKPVVDAIWKHSRYFYDKINFMQDEQYYHVKFERGYEEWITPFMYASNLQTAEESDLCFIVTGGYYNNNSIEFHVEELSEVICFNLDDIHVKCDIIAEPLKYLLPCSTYIGPAPFNIPPTSVFLIVGNVVCSFIVGVICCKRKVTHQTKLMVNNMAHDDINKLTL
eukprot:110789_1